MSSSGERKTVYFHVGLPKTGTTTLQMLLARDAQFLEQTGLHVVRPGNPLVDDVARRAGRICNYGKSDWVARYLMRRASMRLADRLRRVPQSRIMISHENLPGWRIRNLYRGSFDAGPRVALDLLCAAFSDFDVRWIMSTRDAEAHMRSSYGFLAKQKGETEDFDAWAAKLGTKYAFDQMVVEATGYFGADGYVFRMEDEIAKGAPWGHNILSYAGVSNADLAQLDAVATANDALPPVLLPYAQEVNALNLDRDTRKEIIAVLKRVEAAVRAEAKADQGELTQ